MRTGRNIQHGMQGIFVFVLLGLFAVMSTLLVLAGTQMYRSMVRRTEDTNSARVLYSYVRNMVREEDALDAVTVEDTEAGKTIRMEEQLGSETYITRIYVYDGQLYEQFTKKEREFKPQGGTPICPVGVFEPSLEDSMLMVHMEDASGQDCSVQIALYC